MRVKKGIISARRHKKIVKAAKGYRWGRSKIFSLAKNAVTKAGRYSYVGRKRKKIEFRQLWIVRISAALKLLGKTYSRFFNDLKKEKVELDRKILADIAVRNPEIFKKIVQQISS